jgi:hypothetical protein
MNWETLIDRVLVSFDDNVPVVKAQKYLQEAEEDFAFYTKCYQKDWSFWPETGDTYIDLPKDFVGLTDQVQFKTMSLKHFESYQDFSRFRTDGTAKTGNPEYYYLMGDKVYLVPGVATAGLVSFSYAAKPTMLTNSTSKYKFMRYDGLKSDQFHLRDSIKGLTSNATATVADVRRVVQKAGYLVLESITGSFQDDEQVVAITDESEMFLTNLGNWANLLSSWSSLGLGAMAYVQGLPYAYSEAGDEPQIPRAYHSYLADYAKANIAEDNADSRASMFYDKYYANREKIRTDYPNRGIHGPYQVSDAFGSTFI